MSERAIVLNAFCPGKAAELPAFFAGRAELLSQLIDILHSSGICAVVYGDRGVGKTSLAKQCERIALGDVELIDRYNLQSRSLDVTELFSVLYLQCSDGIMSIDELLQRIINTSQLHRNVADLPNLTCENRVEEHKISLKFYENKVQSTYAAKDQLAKYQSLSTEEKLLECISALQETEGKSVLIVIDEIDRIASTRGLASIIKNTSSNNMKYVLVGVGHTISSLIHDHESVARIMAPVEVKRMSKTELETIIDNAEQYLFENKIFIRFSPEARAALVSVSDGMPWFVHVLGKEALRNAYDYVTDIVAVMSDKGKRAKYIRDFKLNPQGIIDLENSLKHTPHQPFQIDVSYMTGAIDSLSKNSFFRQHEDAYLKAVGDSPQREIVLRVFAQWASPDIPTSETYKLAKKLGLKNPSVQVKELCSESFGNILIKAPFAERHYSFRNALFKVFIKARSSVYEDVKRHVDIAWARRIGMIRMGPVS